MQTARADGADPALQASSSLAKITTRVRNVEGKSQRTESGVSDLQEQLAKRLGLPKPNFPKWNAVWKNLRFLLVLATLLDPKIYSGER